MRIFNVFNVLTVITCVNKRKHVFNVSYFRFERSEQVCFPRISKIHYEFRRREFGGSTVFFRQCL